MRILRMKSTTWSCVAVFAGLLFQGVTSKAVAPANDNCAGAILIPTNTAFPYLTPLVTNVNEATLAGDPLPSCIEDAARRGIWYRFVPSQSGIYSFSTGEETATTAFDTIMEVFSSSGECGAPLTSVECNDDAGGLNNRAGLVASLNAGVNYYILVWLSQADDESELESLDVQIRVDKPAVPANDTCALAEVIPANAGFPQRSSIVETIRATNEVASPTPSCGAGQRSVWFRFTPAATSTYILSTGPETATTVSDTLMVLYSTTSDCGALVEVACSDNGEGRGSLFRTLNSGTVYYIAIYDSSTEPVVSETLVQLSVATPTPPTVVTLPMISISSTGAVLTGSVNPNGLQTRFWYEWGPPNTYNSTSQVRLLFPGTATVVSNLVVSGFLPDATYQYRMVATNTLGRSEGVAQTFRWSSTPPLLTAPVRLQSGSYRLSFTGNSKQLYDIETTTNLVVWSHLGPALESPAGSGIFQYTHAGGGAAPIRFYRAKAP